ncbi:MAG: helix-turn-helix domain-containing protein [Victivallaceae bacterium]|nr:helix-turn-helix domain-containing protein [Victivallaceae bacterium]
MKNETKMQVMDFIGFLETSGKLNPQEHKRLREALELNLAEKEAQKLPKRPLTRKEVADFLQVCTRTVDRMCENGQLKFFKLGPRYIRFDIEDVLAVMQQQNPVECVN